MPVDFVEQEAQQWDLPLSLDADEAPEASQMGSKRDCERCERPRSVCLCPSLPSEPLQLAGRVIILQHPHEQKKRLATVPVLQKSVAGVEVLQSRQYRPDRAAHAPLKRALEGAAAGRFPLLVLFPGAGARDVREVGSELRARWAHQQQQEQQQQQPGGSGQQQAGSSPDGRQQTSRGDHPQQQENGGQQQQQAADEEQQPASSPSDDPQQRQQPSRGLDDDPLYVLFVIDGTWRQAKEMYRNVMPHVLQPSGPGVRVHLPPLAPAGAARDAPAGAAVGSAAAEPAAAVDASAGASGQEAGGQQQGGQQQAWQQQREGANGSAALAERPLLLRMEPIEGCLTTCEAVARALGALEPEGERVKQAILRPLAQLAEFQARFDPAVAARLAQGSGYSTAKCKMGMGRLGSIHQIP